MCKVEEMLKDLTAILKSRSTPQSVQQSAVTPTVPVPSIPSRRLSLTPTTDEIYTVPESVLRELLLGCRSRRNLAGRLADRLFTTEEKCTSNYRGVLKKQKLNPKKTDAIRRACIANYPPHQHETATLNCLSETRPPHPFDTYEMTPCGVIPIKTFTVLWCL